jgi:hypothetical protein
VLKYSLWCFRQKKIESEFLISRTCEEEKKFHSLLFFLKRERREEEEEKKEGINRSLDLINERAWLWHVNFFLSSVSPVYPLLPYQ